MRLAQTTPPTAAALPTQAQAQAALDVLRDDARRAQLIAVLEAIVRAPLPPPPRAAAPLPGIQPAPPSRRPIPRLPWRRN